MLRKRSLVEVSSKEEEEERDRDAKSHRERKRETGSVFKHQKKGAMACCALCAMLCASTDTTLTPVRSHYLQLTF